MLDPYSVLGVSQKCDQMKKLKRRTDSLSRKYHPDANINNPNKEQAEEKFKEIQQAYRTDHERTGSMEAAAELLVDTAVMDMAASEVSEDSSARVPTRMKRASADVRRQILSRADIIRRL